MEFLTESLKEVVSKLNEKQKEEIDIIESIFNTNSKNKEETKEKINKFLTTNGIINIQFVINCINKAAEIRPKERESLFSLIVSVFENFKLNFEDFCFDDPLESMLQV